MQLRERGHDVLWPAESGNKGRSDTWQLREAQSEQRVFITGNQHDFRFIHRVLTTASVFDRAPDRHAGILAATRTPSPAAFVDAIDTILAESEITGRMWVWDQTRGWRQDAWRPEQD